MEAGREEADSWFGRGEEALQPDAGMMWRREEEEVERGGIRGARPPLTLPETVTASGIFFPYTLQQAQVGDIVACGTPGWGPEVSWVDRWLGQGWAGPQGSVFFCLSCQLGGRYWRKG